MRRHLTAASVLSVTLLLAWGLVRVAHAQWLVFTPEYPAAPPPTDRVDELAQAMDLAPWDGTLSYWRAIEDSRRMHASWLSADFPDTAAQAARSAGRAIAARPADPYAHILAGEVAAATARHPRTSDEHDSQLWAQAGRHYRNALRSWPVSVRLAQRLAEQLLAEWGRAGGEFRSVTLEAIRQAAAPRGHGRLLRRLFEATRNAGATLEESLAILEEATPLTAPYAHRDLGDLLADIASQQTHASQAGLLRRRSLEAGRRGAIAGNFEPALVRGWVDRWRSWQPEAEEDRLRTMRDLAATHERSPGAWLALSNVAHATGHRGEAVVAALRAADLAVNELAVALREPKLPGPILESADEESFEFLFRLLGVDTSGWGLFFVQRLRAPRDLVGAIAGHLHDVGASLTPPQLAAVHVLEVLGSSRVEGSLVAAGKLLLTANRPHLAVTAFEIALQRNPGAADAHEGLARARRALAAGDHAEGGGRP